MADFNENQNNVFGGVEFNLGNNGNENTSYFEGNVGNVYGNFGTTDVAGAGNGNGTVEGNINFQPIGKENAIAKPSVWSKIKSFLFQEIDLNAPIKVELTPYQQKVEDEINEFLHQEITFKSIANLFKRNK